MFIKFKLASDKLNFRTRQATSFPAVPYLTSALSLINSLPVKADALLIVLFKSHVIAAFRSIFDFTAWPKRLEKIVFISMIPRFVCKNNNNNDKNN